MWGFSQLQMQNSIFTFPPEAFKPGFLTVDGKQFSIHRYKWPAESQKLYADFLLCGGGPTNPSSPTLFKGQLYEPLWREEQVSTSQGKNWKVEIDLCTSGYHLLAPNTLFLVCHQSELIPILNVWFIVALNSETNISLHMHMSLNTI